MSAISKNSKHTLRLALPATSANLGPAFDAAALAMDFYIKLESRPAREFSIIATGRDRDICGRVQDHLILQTYREVLETAGRPVIPLSLKIANSIPIGKGCGSSAAARLAGIALAVRFGRLRWTDAQIIAEASRRERHPDNASACWMGGLTVARMSGLTETELKKEAGLKVKAVLNDKAGLKDEAGLNLDDGSNKAAEAEVVNIRPKGKWPLLLAIPEQSLSTEEARRVLPAQYSRADAVRNVQNSMLLLAAFMQGRPDLLSTALEDRLHQPYRAALCPLLGCLQELKGQDGVLGAVLSGAGPSVLIFLDPRSLDPRSLNPSPRSHHRLHPRPTLPASLEKTRNLVAAHLKRAKLTAELLPTSITLRGARFSFAK